MTRRRKPRTLKPIPLDKDPPPGSAAKFRKTERQSIRFVGLLEGVAEEISSAAHFLERLPDCNGLQPEGRRHAAAIRGVIKRAVAKLEDE